LLCCCTSVRSCSDILDAPIEDRRKRLRTCYTGPVDRTIFRMWLAVNQKNRTETDVVCSLRELRAFYENSNCHRLAFQCLRCEGWRYDYSGMNHVCRMNWPAIREI